MTCKDIVIGTDTGGQPVMARKCYCGTTACFKSNKSFTLARFPRETEYEGLSPEEEKEFYRKTLHSKLLCDVKDCDLCEKTNQ